LFSGERYQDVLALVDSGADSCLFHASVADELGLELREGLRTEFGGIAAGHVVEAFIHTIEMQIEGFADKIAVEVAFADSDAIGGLLGGIGFFDYYKVTLEKYKGRFQVDVRPPAREHS
jgi:predicted aspartyl protease